MSLSELFSAFTDCQESPPAEDWLPLLAVRIGKRRGTITRRNRCTRNLGRDCLLGQSPGCVLQEGGKPH